MRSTPLLVHGKMRWPVQCTHILFRTSKFEPIHQNSGYFSILIYFRFLVYKLFFVLPIEGSPLIDVQSGLTAFRKNFPKVRAL